MGQTASSCNSSTGETHHWLHPREQKTSSARTRNCPYFTSITLHQIPSLNKGQRKLEIFCKHNSCTEHRLLQKPPASSEALVQRRSKGAVLLPTGTRLRSTEFLLKRLYIHEEENKPSPTHGTFNHSWRDHRRANFNHQQTQPQWKSHDSCILHTKQSSGYGPLHLGQTYMITKNIRIGMWSLLIIHLYIV